MKLKHVIVLLILTGTTQVKAQSWFEVGIKGGYGLTQLINANNYDDKRIEPSFSYAPTCGIKVGYNFNDEHGIMIDAMYGWLNQGYTIQRDSTSYQDVNVKLTTVDVPLLYRHSKNGSYVELGPQMSFVLDGIAKPETSFSSNIANQFNKNYLSGVFGFGANFIGVNSFNLILGFRFTYSFQDMVSDEGGKSSNSYFPVSTYDHPFSFQSYKPTNALTARIIAQLDFDLGYFSRSKCGKKRFLTF